jgi:hypothetical protein
MSPESKRIALARKAGWVPHNESEVHAAARYFNPGQWWRLPSEDTIATTEQLPDFTGSLDAIAELEGLLTDEEQLMYADLLCREVLRLPTSKCLYYLVATATASQRADALCAVWGLDKGESK